MEKVLHFCDKFYLMGSVTIFKSILYNLINFSENYIYLNSQQIIYNHFYFMIIINLVQIRYINSSILITILISFSFMIKYFYMFKWLI